MIFDIRRPAGRVLFETVPDDGRGTMIARYEGTSFAEKRYFQHSYESINEGMKTWVDGGFVQDAFPFMSADDREFLLTGNLAWFFDKDDYDDGMRKVKVFAKFNFDVYGDEIENELKILLGKTGHVCTRDLTDVEYQGVANYYNMPLLNEEIIVEVLLEKGTYYSDAIDLISDRLADMFGFEVIECDTDDEWINNNTF